MPTRNVACCTAGVGLALWPHLIRSSALNPGTHTFGGVVCCVGRDLLKSMFLITESPIRSIVMVWWMMTVPSSSVVVTSGQEGTSGLPGRLGDGWGWEREGVLASAPVGVFDSASDGVVVSALHKGDGCSRGDAVVSMLWQLAWRVTGFAFFLNRRISAMCSAAPWVWRVFFFLPPAVSLQIIWVTFKFVLNVAFYGVPNLDLGVIHVGLICLSC